MQYSEFEQKVLQAGLQPRTCSPDHWQILGGRVVVNVWANTKRGFRFQVLGQQSKSGSLKQAINEAQPEKPKEKPKKRRRRTKPVQANEIPPWEEEQVGIIRRFWRWLW